jgi:hypothetical protein
MKRRLKMKKPNGYDQVQAKTISGFSNPTAGTYVLGIIKANIEMSKKGNEMLVLELDIIEGEFQKHYRNVSERLGKNCLLKHYRVTDSEKSMPYFKGDIKAIEESNPGFKFDFDESKLRGKKVGGMLAEEEYETMQGEVKTALKLAFLCSVDTAKSGKLKPPTPKKIYPDSGFGFDDNKSNDDDLPF